jgi:hypothetical protein
MRTFSTCFKATVPNTPFKYFGEVHSHTYFKTVSISLTYYIELVTEIKGRIYTRGISEHDAEDSYLDLRGKKYEP